MTAGIAPRTARHTRKAELESAAEPALDHDSSTNHLIRSY
jgi:hypothetical protein